MFINGLNQDLSLPVKRTRIDQETGPLQTYLVWQRSPLALQMSHLKRTLLTFLIFDSSVWRLLNETKTSFCYCQIRTGVGGCHKFKCLGTFSPLSSQPFQCSPSSQWQNSKNYRLSSRLPWITLLQVGDEPLPILNDARTTLLVLQPAIVKQSLPQTVGISNEPQKVPVSEFFPFLLKPLERYLPFSP